MSARGSRLREHTSRERLVPSLPSLFQQDDFTSRFVSAFDDVAAPVFSSIDNVDAYLDPGTTPEDFLEWLAGWFGLVVDGRWSVERQRRALRQVVELYRWRGTARGLRGQLALYLGPHVDVEIEEAGAVEWSPSPGGDLPAAGPSRVRVRVTTSGEPIDGQRLTAMVRAVVPAHLSVEVVGLDS